VGVDRVQFPAPRPENNIRTMDSEIPKEHERKENLFQRLGNLQSERTLLVEEYDLKKRTSGHIDDILGNLAFFASAAIERGDLDKGEQRIEDMQIYIDLMKNNPEFAERETASNDERGYPEIWESASKMLKN